jgi:hypothetical protein
MCLPVKAAIVIILLFSGLFGAFAQETIAVHPLSDETDSPMTVIFFEELIKAIPNVPGHVGAYRPYTIDLVNNRPADVPPGGFPPYICPSTSLTANAAYAITGEIGVSRETPGEYWVRIYLWQMDNGRLISSDMVNASDRASSATSYPFILGSLFDTIEEYKQAKAQPEIPQQIIDQAQTVYRPTSRPKPLQNWLNLGLHVAGGNSTWFNGETTSSFLNASGSFQIGVNVLSHLSIQAEANMNVHYDLEDFENNFWHMNVPLLFRFPFQSDPIKVSLYLGPYLLFPMPWSENIFEGVDFYKLIGISYGLTVGWKLGPGYFFINGRFSHLLFFSDEGMEYPSNSAVFGLGYEIELIKKKVRQ